MVLFVVIGCKYSQRKYGRVTCNKAHSKIPRHFLKVLSIDLRSQAATMFRVRLITVTSTILKQYYQNLLARQGWRPCIGDIDCYLELDPTGIYVGELNGKPIGTASAIKYENGYCHLGSMAIEAKYQKFGYGMELGKARLVNSPRQKNLGGYTTPKLVKAFEQWHGVIPRWEVGIYDLNISKTLDTLRVSSDCCEVKGINNINMQDLYKYDTDVFGYNRNKFLEKWLNTVGAHARVAVDKQGSILGYVAVRTAFFQDEGYKLGPLFCKDIDIGKALVKGVFEDVHERGLSSSNSVVLDSPIEVNEEAQKLMEFVEANYLGRIEFMTTNDIPKGHFKQWFAITSSVSG